MLDITQSSIISGTISTLIVVCLTIKYQGRFDGADLASFLGAFFSGTNIPPAFFLIIYIFMDDPHLAQSKLKGYEKYICMAGLALLFTSLLGLWKLCQAAYTPISKEEKLKAGSDAEIKQPEQQNNSQSGEKIQSKA